MVQLAKVSYRIYFVEQAVQSSTLFSSTSISFQVTNFFYLNGNLVCRLEMKRQFLLATSLAFNPLWFFQQCIFWRVGEVLVFRDF